MIGCPILRASEGWGITNMNPSGRDKKEVAVRNRSRAIKSPSPRGAGAPTLFCEKDGAPGVLCFPSLAGRG